MNKPGTQPCDQPQPQLATAGKRPTYLASGACLGAGKVQWSVGGWFGSQLGITLWMLLAAGALTFSSMQSAGVVFAIFIAANAAGCALWRRRATLAPHTAFQLLLLAGAIATTALFLTLESAGLVEIIDELSDPDLPLPLWAHLGIFPLMMAIMARINKLDS
ncbi:MAG: hypothetical protein ACI8QC_003516 [Planctomycetota bacterium]|jgi:hypothetical protein